MRGSNKFMAMDNDIDDAICTFVIAECERTEYSIDDILDALLMHIQLRQKVVQRLFLLMTV